MTTLSKRRKALVEKIDRDKAYDAAEAWRWSSRGRLPSSTNRWTPR